MMSRGLICLFMVLLSSPGHAQLSLLKKLGRAADVVSVGDAISDRAPPPQDRFVTALRTYPDARAIIAAEAGVFLLDPSGSKSPVPIVAGEPTVRLTDEFIEFFRATDLLVAEEQVEYFKAVILQLEQMRKQSTRMLRSDGTVVRLHPVPGANGPGLVLEYTRDVYLQRDRNMDELIELLKQSPRNWRLISLLDATDGELRRGLNRLPGLDHRVADQLQASEVQQLVSEPRRSTVVVIGHIERGALLVRDAAGAIQRSMPLADLEAAARSADAMLIVLGCADRNCSSAALKQDPTLPTVAEAIGRALKQQSVGAALGSLGRATGGLLLKAGSTDELRASILVESLPRLEPMSSPSALGAAQVMLVSVDRDDELRLRLIPGIPSMIQLSYMVCFVLTILSIKSIFQLWGMLSGPTPQLRSAPLAWCAGQLTRGIGLLALMPWMVAASVVLATGVWVWPLLFPLLSQLMAWPAALVGVYFGIRWYKEHADEVGEEPWRRRFIAVPVFSLVLTLIIGVAVWPLRELIELLFAESAGNSVVRWSLNACELAAAYLAGRWIFAGLQRRGWMPQEWLDCLLVWPLRGIEYAAHRVWRRAVQ